MSPNHPLPENSSGIPVPGDGPRLGGQHFDSFAHHDMIIGSGRPFLFFLLLFVVAIVVVAVVRHRRTSLAAPPVVSPALTELELLYVRGSVTREEFLSRRADLM